MDILCVLSVFLASVFGVWGGDIENTIASKIITKSYNVNAISSVLFSKSNPKQCNGCDVLADLTDGITGALDITDYLANEHVIDLYCLKAYVPFIVCLFFQFQLDLKRKTVVFLVLFFSE